MQLHAFILFFIITTDKTLALSNQHCGGNVELDQDPAGHINLILPERLTNKDSLALMNLQPHKTPQVSVCSWMLDIPAGRTLFLKPEWSSIGSILTVRCISVKKIQALESGKMAVLSDCDTNKAVLSWTGTEPSSNIIQLTYYVQENERKSSEDSLTLLPDVSSQTQTGISPVTVTEGGEDQLYEGLESSSTPQLMSNGSAKDHGLHHTTSGQYGLPVTARADREPLPLPEEKANNGADTSGAAHLTDAPFTATERTRPYFQREVKSAEPGREIDQTQQTTETTIGFFGTDKHKFVQTIKHKDTNAEESVSTANNILPSMSSTMELDSQNTRDSSTTLIPHAAIGTFKDKQGHSWRTSRNTASFDSISTFFNLLDSSTKPPHSSRKSDPTSSLSLSYTQRKTPSTTITELHTLVSTTEATSLHPSQTDSLVSSVSEASVQTPAFKQSDKFDNTEQFQGSSSESQTIPPQSTEAFTHSSSGIVPLTQMSNKETGTRTQGSNITISPLSTVAEDPVQTSSVAPSFSTPITALTIESQNSEATTETFTLDPVYTLVHSSTYSPTPESPLLSSTSSQTQTQTAFPVGSTVILTASIKDSVILTAFMGYKTTTPQATQKRTHQASVKNSHDFDATTPLSPLPFTTTEAGHRDEEANIDGGDEFLSQPPSTTTTHSPLSVTPQRLTPQINSSRENQPGLISQTLTSTLTWSSTHNPRFYIVPNQPIAIRVESIELLLQIVVEESKSAMPAGLEQDTAIWMQPYLQRAPGFNKLLGVWSSGHAVQSLVSFKTSEALQWLSRSGPTSLLERTGMAQAVREGTTFRSSKINNITVGGLQSDVCDWLLQCPVGFTCISHSGDTNYSCSSVCHFDHCHHHGICTHHPGQLPVCRCLVGDDFWYMGQRCDVRMTRARLVGACLAVLVVIVIVIGVFAFVAVRRYRAILIQAKVDQTRSSYRRFNHFDELSGRFWLRSWAGSADSLDNPAFTRSDDLLHLRALDRPCCYHDDTLSLPSTCPSHGPRINTIYPNSSQYGWRGSEMSMGDGVLDSGKASDLSVCSWPVEPIHWTPFPLLQQLASHRTPTMQVRMSRPRSYCEGMELVEMGRSWTA